MMTNLLHGAHVANKLFSTIARLRLLLVMFLILTVSANAWGATWEKATSIAAGDVVLLVCESKKMELSGVNSYGSGTAYSTSPAGEYELTVEAGSSSGTFSLKNGNNYLYWNSGNSLATNATKSANTSWKVTFSNGNATISNAKDNSRKLQWNASSPRFACYTTSQTAVQLYKKVSTDPCASLVAPIVTTTNITNNSFTLSWNAVAGAESYNVYNYTTDVAENITTTSYTFTELTPNTEYEWEIETVKSTCSKGTTGTTTTRTLATITLSEAGVETPVTGKYVGDSYTLPSTTSQSCGDLEFVGWSTVEINNSVEKPTSNFHESGAPVTLAADQTFYAVFAEETTTNSGNIETTITIPNETLIESLSGSYGNKSFSYEGYTFYLNACVQSSYCQMRDNSTISFIQIPTLPGPITKISCTDCKNASGSAYSGTLHFKSSKTRGNSDTDDIDKITYTSVNSFEWEIDNDTHKTGYLLTSAGLRLKNLSITYITSGETIAYSDYTTQCSNKPTHYLLRK